MNEPCAGRREWTALAVLCPPLLMVSMDVSVLFFAVPDIAADLHPSATQQLWIFDVYGFVLAGLLITMGSLGDRIGRRRLLLTGAVLFSGASVLAAYAPSAGALIGARALLGVAGATLMPSTLATIRHMFRVDAERTKAVAVWSAVLAGGVSVGPIISGVLLEHFWWGSVFLVNVPVMVALLAVGPFLLPESRGIAAARFDWLSSLLVLGSVLPVIAAIKSLAMHGWSWTVVAYAACGLAVGAAFIRRELRSAAPMVDLRMLGQRRFGGSVLINVLAMFAIMGNSVILTQYIQSVLGMSPLRAALWSLAPSLVVGVAAPVAAQVAVRVGRPRVMTAGLLVAAAGFGLLTRVHLGSPLALILVAAALVAAGLVSVLSLITDYVLAAAPAERSGAVAGLTETSSEFGGALGMAVLGSVLDAAYRAHASGLVPHGVTGPAGAAARGSLAGAVSVAGTLPGATGRAVLHAGRAAYVAGLHVASVTAAGVLVAAAALTLVLLRGPDEVGTPATAERDDEVVAV